MSITPPSTVPEPQHSTVTDQITVPSEPKPTQRNQQTPTNTPPNRKALTSAISSHQRVNKTLTVCTKENCAFEPHCLVRAPHFRHPPVSSKQPNPHQNHTRTCPPDPSRISQQQALQAQPIRAHATPNPSNRPKSSRVHQVTLSTKCVCTPLSHQGPEQFHPPRPTATPLPGSFPLRARKRPFIWGSPPHGHL